MKRTIFLMLAVLLSTLSASAYDFMVDGIAYEKNGDGKSVAVCEGGDYTGDIAIPEKVTYDGATYSVTEIGSSAFYDCRGLTSVTIPNSVTEIGESPFEGCTGLTSVTFNAEYCESPSSYEHAFFIDCPLTSLVIGNDVTSIPDYLAYNQKKLIKVTIPNSVISIGESAFEGCTGLTSVTIPNSVTFLSGFNGCTGLTSVTIGNSVTEIGREAFAGCTGLSSVTIPNSVTKIGWEAFKGCTGLTSVTIGNSVISIGASAFSGCTGLPSVTIPNSVTSISNRAFKDCTGLTSVTIPNSVTEIGESAFEGCTGLKKIYSLNPVPPVIYEGTFETYHTDLFVPKGCYLKYKEAEYWKNFTFISEINVETGDIDGDGEINVGDVTAHINKLLNAASYDDAVCDINGDGEVNVTDVTSLINMILE